MPIHFPPKKFIFYIYLIDVFLHNRALGYFNGYIIQLRLIYI
jgi:hypothetical protein